MENAKKLTSRFILFAMLASLLAFSAPLQVGCAKSSEDVLRETVAEEFDTYKNLENEALDKIAKTAEEEGLSDLGISGADFANAVLEGFDYRIDSIEINDEVANVSVTLTSKSSDDFEDRLSSGVQYFVDSGESVSMSAEEKNMKIGEITMQSFADTQMIEEQVQIEFQLQDKTWVSTNAAEQLASLDSLVFAG